MSDEKREALIASGQLAEDGSRKHRCPLCGSEVTEDEHARLLGNLDAVAESEAVEAVAVTGDEKGTRR